MTMIGKCSELTGLHRWTPHRFDLAWSGSGRWVVCTVDLFDQLFGHSEFWQSLLSLVTGQSALITDQVKQWYIYSLENKNKMAYQSTNIFILYSTFQVFISLPYLPLVPLQGCEQQWWGVVLQWLTYIWVVCVSGLDQVWMVADLLQLHKNLQYSDKMSCLQCFLCTRGQ